MVPVSPENEPWRVTPPELNPSVPPVTTVAVACGVGGLHWYVIVIAVILIWAVDEIVTLEALPLQVPVVPE